MSEKVVGRFAPSPTGRMHAGNIYAALAAWLVAKSQGGEIVLRIEDLDRERSKSEYIDAVQRDFEMLGLTWDRGPFFQHNRDEAYAAPCDSLKERGIIYPCYCTLRRFACPPLPLIAGKARLSGNLPVAFRQGASGEGGFGANACHAAANTRRGHLVS